VELGVALAVDVAAVVGVTASVGVAEAVTGMMGVRVDRAGVWRGEPLVACSTISRSLSGVVVAYVTPLNRWGICVGIDVTNGMTAIAGVGNRSG
jgi:hypothetical protein